MDERSPLDADRQIELVLAITSAVLLVAGVSLLLRPGRRLIGAGLVALGALAALAALALYVFATFHLPI